MMQTPYRTWSLDEILNEAERSADPLVRELAERLDSVAYALLVYRRFAVRTTTDSNQPALIKED